MTDIVERLRSFGPDRTLKQTGTIVPYEVCVDAADEIERLRSALQKIEKWFGEFPEDREILGCRAAKTYKLRGLLRE
jgi:hypothetical protein